MRSSVSGNRAFDEYRMATLRRLEEEQREFKEFLNRLRHAKDKAEFDEFMAERSQRPQGPSEEMAGTLSGLSKNQMAEVAACLKLDLNTPIPMLKTMPIQPENRDGVYSGVREDRKKHICLRSEGLCG